MTANSPPYVLQAGSHSAQLFRQAVSSMLASGGGVVGAGDYAVTQNGAPNMTVNVAGGAPGSGGGIWVPGTTSAGVQGQYFGFNDATVNLSIAASNPTNPRIDTPIAQVQDAAYSGATSSFQLAVVTGTPAASPVAPSIPASSYALADVAVAANATSVVNANITDRRSQASLGMGQNHSSLSGGGCVLIPTPQSTTSATYTLLGTPDQITGIVLPPKALLMVAYQAIYSGTGGTVKAALFMNGVQVVIQTGATSPTPQEAAVAVAAGRNSSVSTTVTGIALSAGLASQVSDATTGQIVGSNASATPVGGPTAIFAAAGTYSVDVRYNISGGNTFSASGRRLYAWVERF